MANEPSKLQSLHQVQETFLEGLGGGSRRCHFFQVEAGK